MSGDGSRAFRVEPPEYELWGRAAAFASAVGDGGVDDAVGSSDLASMRRRLAGDGDGHGDGDRDGRRGLLTMAKKRLVRVEAAGCWGICSPEDCCALARFGAEGEPEVPWGYPERFLLQGVMLEILYCCNSCL